MRLPPEMGRAGLALTSFLVVMSVGVLALARPAVSSAPFVMSVLLLAFALVTGTLIAVALRRSLRAQPLPTEKENHHE